MTAPTTATAPCGAAVASGVRAAAANDVARPVGLEATGTDESDEPRMITECMSRP
jgi:hypothetical protein